MRTGSAPLASKTVCCSLGPADPLRLARWLKVRSAAWTAGGLGPQQKVRRKKNSVVGLVAIQCRKPDTGLNLVGFVAIQCRKPDTGLHLVGLVEIQCRKPDTGLNLVGFVAIQCRKPDTGLLQSQKQKLSQITIMPPRFSCGPSGPSAPVSDSDDSEPEELGLHLAIGWRFGCALLERDSARHLPIEDDATA